LQPRVKSKQDLKQYILRRLGYPVVNVEVTDDQLEDIIYETLQKYFQFAYGGTQLRFGVIVPTKDNQREFRLPFEVNSVLRVYDYTFMAMNTNIQDPFSINYIVARDFLNFSFFKGDLLTWELVKEFIETLDIKYNVKIEFDFNPVTKILYFINTSTVKDKKYGIIYYEIPDIDDPEIEEYIYDNRWIKEYATELARYQWGVNLTKYEGTMLPNGMQLNAEQIKQDALQTIEQLQNELIDTYQLPPDFFLG
jgi:hypothetical protein